LAKRLFFLPLQADTLTMSKSNTSPFASKSFASLAEDSGFLMLQVSSLWAHYHNKAVKKHYGLTHIQYAVLTSVYWLSLHSEKQITQTILAQHTKIKPMTISQILNVLENKNYVCRTTHLTDVRAKAVEVTPQGKELLDKAVKTIFEVDTAFFSVLDKNIKHFNHYMFELLNANDL